jgi:hypothetical protein
MRAIASSTACSGLMPSAITRWTAWPHTHVLLPDPARPPFLVADGARDVVRPGHDLDRRAHAVRVARIQPERLLDQLAHRWQQAVAGKVQPMRKPAILRQEANERLGQLMIDAFLEDHGARDEPDDDDRLAVRALRPVGGHSVRIVVVGPCRAQRARDGQCRVRGHDDRLGEEHLVVCRCWSSSRLGRRAALTPDRGARGAAVHEPCHHRLPDSLQVRAVEQVFWKRARDLFRSV